MRQGDESRVRRRHIPVLSAVMAALWLAAPAQGAVATDPVPTGAPQSQSPPALTGTPREGSTLTASPGEWTGAGPIAYAYQWQRCDPAGSSCADLTGATDPAYVLMPADVGAAVRVVVTASNSAGQQSAPSPSLPVEGRPPRNLTPPKLLGDAAEGTRLTIDVGTWAARSRWSTRTPVAALRRRRVELRRHPRRHWRDVHAHAADMGSTLRAQVTGTNAADRPPSPRRRGRRAGRPPVATSPPTVSGTARDGQQAHRGAGHVERHRAADVRVAERCDGPRRRCLPIPGATGQTYVLTPADVGSKCA